MRAQYLTVDPIELVEFTELIAPARWSVGEHGGSLLVTNSEVHFFLKEDDDGLVTVESNDRDARAPNTWVADLANASYALRYILIAVNDTFRKGNHPDLVLPGSLDKLPAEASVTEASPVIDGESSDRQHLYIDGTFVGTFGYYANYHDAVAAALLLPLTLNEIVTRVSTPSLPHTSAF